MNNSELETIINRSKELNGTHKAFAEELLIPNLNKNDGMRITMFDSNLPQAKVLNEPNFPHVFTNFENEIGKYSTGYKKAVREWIIIDKVQKNDLICTYILKDVNSNYIELYNFKPAERITEKYGYKYKRPILEKSIGDIVNKDEVMVESTTYDEDHNFCYGRDLKAVYLAYDNMTYEDAIVISESCVDKLASTTVDEIVISLNNNDILLNLQGNSKEYKSFPDVGEESNSSILTARRRLSYESMLYDFTNSNLRKINSDTDKIFYSSNHSIVYDVEVFFNGDKESLEAYPYNKQILKYYNMNRTYYNNLINALSPYIDDSEYECSDNVKFYYDRACDMISPDTQFRYDNNPFGHIILKIKTFATKKLAVGMKITNRYGGKGVISAILPDSEMPINEFGEVADICLNPMGVPGRLNLGQLYEFELNFIAESIVRHIKQSDDRSYQLKEIMKFYKIVNKNQYKFLVKRLKSYNNAQKSKFLKDCLDKGLFIHQPPFFGNISMDGMIELYETFDYVQKYTFTVKGKKIEQPLIMANIYYMLLKHDPISKLMARASGDLSLNNLPSKSSSFKYHNTLFSKTPVKIGEMELTSLLLTKDIKSVMKYLSQTSNDPRERSNLFHTMLVGNPFNIGNIELQNKSGSINSKIVRAEMKAIGLKMVDNRDDNDKK